MSLTEYPQGVSSFGMPIIGIGEETMTTGNVFFVDSGAARAADGNAMTDPKKPGATIDAAIARCTANNGDIIFVMPGHDENPLASITMDVAGVWIRGLGWGASRPTVTFGATAATLSMEAASCRVSNIRFDLGTVATTVTNAVAVTATDCIIENIETVSHASSQFTNIVSVIATGTRVIIRNSVINTLLTASASSGIYLDGCDDIQILNNVVMGHFGASACLENVAGADEILGANIVGNVFRNDSSTSGDLAVNLDDAATGMFANNMLSGGLATTAANYEIGDMASLESYIVDTSGVDVHGIVLGTAAV